MFKKVHHIAFAVYDLKKTIKVLKELFGVVPFRKISLKNRKMKVALFKIGDSWVEYLAPISDDSPLNIYLEKKGEGFHHIAYKVNSIEEANDQLPKGVLLPMRKSNVGEWTVADIQKEYTFGMKTQLIEE